MQQQRKPYLAALLLTLSCALAWSFADLPVARYFHELDAPAMRAFFKGVTKLGESQWYLVGGLSSLISSKAQRLGDLAANTVVIREPKIPRPDLEQLLTHKYNSLRDHPHLVARLRQRSSPREADIALQALLRRDELEPLARIELFTQIAAHFKKIITFPQEVTDGITDEQFVRNVVDVLFRSK